MKPQPPDVNGIMYPYNTRETEKIYNKIKQKYNLTDSEIFTNYFDVDYVICEFKGMLRKWIEKQLHHIMINVGYLMMEL